MRFSFIETHLPPSPWPYLRKRKEKNTDDISSCSVSTRSPITPDQTHSLTHGQRYLIAITTHDALEPVFEPLDRFRLVDAVRGADFGFTSAAFGDAFAGSGPIFVSCLLEFWFFFSFSKSTKTEKNRHVSAMIILTCNSKSPFRKSQLRDHI